MTTKFSSPRDYRKYALDDLPNGIASIVEDLLEDVRGCIDRTTNLVFYGPEGSGKTAIAAAIANELTARGWMIAWMDADCFPTKFAEIDDEIDTGLSADIYFIDDLGKESHHKSMKSLIAGRNKRGKGITIYTSNLDIDDDDISTCALSKMYGPSTRSRVLGNSITFLVDGEDRRLT